MRIPPQTCDKYAVCYRANDKSPRFSDPHERFVQKTTWISDKLRCGNPARLCGKI